jgi:hypothetical protein
MDPGPDVIFLIGMSRSGTSAMTRVLSLCGAHLPCPLVAADKSNPTGYWEPLEALLFNDDFLQRHNATWFDPTMRLQGEMSFPSEKTEVFLERIRAFLSGCPSSPLLVIKEPRITALADFWFEAARRHGLTVKVIVCVRPPQEVVASVVARDSTSVELATAMWLKYSLLAERRSRHRPRVFVEYSALLKDWRSQIARISNTLKIPLSTQNSFEIDTFLSADLYHQKLPALTFESFGSPWLTQIYAALSDAARDGFLDTKLFDRIYKEYSEFERGFRLSLDDFRRNFGTPR